MLANFIQDAFRRISGLDAGTDLLHGLDMSEPDLDRMVEHVIDESYGRLRILPGYLERLRQPVAASFRYIDKLVEELPPPMDCCRSGYLSDARVNAFFSSPDQIAEVFSSSEEVRGLFDQEQAAERCWALVCMRKKESRRFGMELVGDQVRRDVMQTGVSFSDHQILSPAVSESGAKQGLKCCIFNSLLAYIRRRAKTAKENSLELENRLRSLRSQLKDQQNAAERRELQLRITELEDGLGKQELSLITLDDHLEFIAQVLEHPEQYVSRQAENMRLSKMGVKVKDTDTGSGTEVPVAEIHVACHEPRVAALACFPREELTARQDYLKKADLFLAI